MSYIDGHCHLADPRIAADLPRLIDEAQKLGIERFIQGGVDPADWQRQLALKTQYPQKIVTAFGLHPWWVAAHSKAEFDQAFQLLSDRIGEADALGEIGLDHSPKMSEATYALQEVAYREQLRLAASPPAAGKPLILHIVRAHPVALRALREAGISDLKGLVHSFSGSREIAREYLDLGLSLSISGVITRKGFETLKRTVPYIPLERLIIETDCPDQSPAEWSKPHNEPSSLIQVAQVVADLRGMQARSVLEASTNNLRGLFRYGND